MDGASFLELNGFSVERGEGKDFNAFGDLSGAAIQFSLLRGVWTVGYVVVGDDEGCHYYHLHDCGFVGALIDFLVQMEHRCPAVGRFDGSDGAGTKAVLDKLRELAKALDTLSEGGDE